MPSTFAAQLGEPSYVWRAGQTFRWRLIVEWGRLHHATTVLDHGTGVGLYLAQMSTLPNVELAVGTEYEFERAHKAAQRGHTVQADERLPFPDETFDTVLSHEVLEHVGDDRLAVQEIVRVLRVGGRAVIFVPNRLWLFETHGIYWRGTYHFGNIPLVNYLPTPLRNRLAPHVRAYTGRSLRRLFEGMPVRFIHHSHVFPAFDNVIARRPMLGRFLRTTARLAERTPARIIGLSHLLVVEKIAP
nr:class I SAM-dependent methyltransferase [Ardenticatena sp.]